MTDGIERNTELLEQQHKIRGLVSSFKARKFEKGQKPPRSSKYRSELRQILLRARAVIRPAQFEDFLSWTASFQESQLPELARFPTGYEDLSGVFTKAPVVSLERELLWISARCKVESKTLTWFRRSADRLEELVCRGEYASAIETLEAIERTLSTSLWSVQLRIALEHQAGGLERQKQYTAEIRRIHRRGLLGFVAFHTSTRNEDRTTLSKYTEDIRGRIEKHRYYDDALKTYARFRLAGEWPSTQTGLADVLRIEQSHSITDIYETFIAAIQELARRGPDARERSLLTACLTTVAPITDFRLDKAAAALGERPSRPIPARNRDISDSLFGGNLGRAVFRARTISRRSGERDIWQYVYAGLALAASRTATSWDSLRRFSFAGLAAVFSPGTTDDSFAMMGKFSTNFAGLPVARALLEVLAQARPLRPDASWKPWLVGLNSPTTGVEDLLPNAQHALSESPNTTPTTDAWCCFWREEHIFAACSANSAALLRAAGYLRDARYRDAKEILLPLGHVTQEPFRSLVTSLLLHAHFGSGDKQDVIELIASEGTRSDARFLRLPVLASLKDYSWPDYKTLSNRLSAPLALHLLWRSDENSATQSLVRFATGHFIKASGAARPSSLAEKPDLYLRHQLLYFLWAVCAPQILDTARVLKSSREVMDERLAICAALKGLDPGNSETYDAEILTIANKRTLEEGQWIVNSARIHVDTDALYRWATRELAEDFARYIDLLKVRLSPNQNFDDVLKEILTSKELKDAFKPEDEADAVLFNAIHRLRDEFLNNPGFGLDFYLSKRIRHQSFIGLIRGPLEFAQLITTRESETGNYKHNDFWLQKFSHLGEREKAIVSDAFDKFAAKFDDVLIRAKDAHFQVRSSEKPEGLISIDLPAAFYLLLRSMATMDVDVGDFVATAVVLLWGALEPSLARVRLFVSEQLKTRVAEAFDELRARVRSSTSSDPVLLEFSAEVARRSTEVQNALDEAASWFTHIDTAVANQSYKLADIVSICVDTALKCHRPFDPTIQKDVQHGDLQMDARTLVFVHDVLFVAIGNVRAHSGIDKPNIAIQIRPDVDDGTISIEVLSDSRPRNRDAKEKRRPPSLE